MASVFQGYQINHGTVRNTGFKMLSNCDAVVYIFVTAILSDCCVLKRVCFKNTIIV